MPSWIVGAVAFGAIAGGPGPAPAFAAARSAEELMHLVHSRAEGPTRAQTVRVILTDRRGMTRVEKARLQGSLQPDGTRRTLV